MRKISRTVTVQAPTGGWNARDSLAAMGKADAVILDNMVAKPTEVALRGGSSDHVTGITGTVETLATYNKANGTYQMFAGAVDSYYDTTSPGAVGAAVITGLTNTRHQTVNFQTTGGKFLYMVNGADDPYLWDGTTWVAVDAVSTPAITGVTTSTLVHVNVFQRRLWFVEKDSYKVWYLAVDSIGGAATVFDLGAVFPGGGYLMAMGTWTIDSGSGMDDHAVFLSSEGEIAVYRGTDPASASTWGLVGVYRVGEPIGRRCFTQYGSDLLIISKDGVLPMSKALMSSRVTTGISITDKIQKAMNESVVAYGGIFGWELATFADQNLLMLNVPISTTQSYQYVMCTLNGSWSRFLNWNAATFVRMGNQLFFGTAGKVVQAYTGTNDSGNNINFEALPSFQYHGGMVLKRYTMARPTISLDNPAIGLLIGLNVDFDLSAPASNPSFTPTPAGLWDSAVWDASIWGGQLFITKNWQTIGEIGYCAAIHMKGAGYSTNLSWQSVDYIFEPGQGFT